MYYHIMIQTDEIGEIYELNKSDLNMIIEDFIKPFIMNTDFNLNGYFIEPSKVKRIKITETEHDANYYYEVENQRMFNSGVFVPIGKGHYVIDSDKYCKDITREVLNSVRASINNLDTSHKPNKEHQSSTIFVAYSYREDDEEFVKGFKELLEDKGFNLLDGKADRLGSISQAIIEKIRISDIVTIIMTKRDKKENGKFTTSSWLLEEKGAAIALKKQVAMFVEEEIDENDIGGLQGDSQRFHFTKNNFMSKVMNFIKILGNRE